ncbi:O-antigen ligase family protein [Alkaliflexus imshenetskii]|uniref:O-antigen ligase family protein n=1 Tax=Alkaliflexus imshenetskii TaxID=286730 RepID=UPI00047B0B03|nr:O-antigen ligase family protein [Alkaliflexus imshenetskii]
MIDLLKTKKGHLMLIAIHLALGVMVKYAPSLVSLAYVGLFAWSAFDVIYTRDRGSRAGFYAIYLMGLEMIYRMAGAHFSWEMGKYVCILICLVGMLSGQRRYIAWNFLFLLILLLPSIFLADGPDSLDIRKKILFNISGPLSLVFTGLYFYRRQVDENTFYHSMRMAFLPAFTIIAALSVVANIATLQFTSLQSNPEAAGGFGPNQVSTVLGWFILLHLLFKVNKQQITAYEWLDWVILFYIVLRALLTFSRGGVMGSLLSLAAAVLVLTFAYHSFRKQLMKKIPYILAGMLFFVGVFFVANRITNNFLLYRYQGLTTTEVRTGVRLEERSILTGRDQIMRGDIEAFFDNPLFGTGYGMAVEYRAKYYGAAAAHTEFVRLLSENGMFGLLFMLIGMVWLPVYFFVRSQTPLTRFFFIAFYLLSMFTMFHAAMRLALPGVLFGTAFMLVKPTPKNTEEKKQPQLASSQLEKTA